MTKRTVATKKPRAKKPAPKTKKTPAPETPKADSDLVDRADSLTDDENAFVMSLAITMESAEAMGREDVSELLRLAILMVSHEPVKRDGTGLRQWTALVYVRALRISQEVRRAIELGRYAEYFGKKAVPHG